MAISDENVIVTATVKKEVKATLETLAEKNHRSVSKEIAFAIDEYLEKVMLENARVADLENEEV